MIWRLFLLCGIFSFASSNGQTISTIAGNGMPSVTGDCGSALSASTGNPAGGIFDKYGSYYHVDGNGNKLRRINSSGFISTIAGAGPSGYSGDGGPATAAYLNYPQAVAIDTVGNIYIAESGNNAIRKVNMSSGLISTFAGTGTGGFLGDGGSATGAQIWNPQDVVADKFGNVYIADMFNYRVRKVDPSGVISTCAGTGVSGYTGDGGPATDAQLGYPSGLAVDSWGNLYIADWGGLVNRVRKVSPTGIISTVAGNGAALYAGDGIPATDAQLSPLKVAVQDDGTMYIADRYNDRVYRVDPSGIFHLIAGNGTEGDVGDGGSAISAQLFNPTGVAIDECGNVYVPTVGHVSVTPGGRRIRKITFSVLPNVNITASPNDTICFGTSVSLNCTPTAISAGTYQWYVNGVPVGGTVSTYSYSPVDGDSVYCKVTGIATCSGNTVTRFSNGVKITVLPTTTVSLSLAPSPNDTVCVGTAVSIATTAIGGGSSPGYHWYKNGVPVLGGASYSFTPATADSVSCVFVSNATCPVPNDTVEQHVRFTVLPYVTPALSISSSLGPEGYICEGDTVHFTSSVSGGGVSPLLQWRVNGADVATGATYAYSPSDGDTVHCVLTSSEMCTTSATAISNTIGPISVLPVVTPAVAISATASFANAGETVTVNAVVSGTSAYSIKWSLNSVYHATTTLPQTTFVKGPGTDIITARVIPTGVLCFDSTDSAPLAVAIPNAISEVKTVQTLTVYPNPVSNTLYISSTAKLHYVTITDAVGKQWKTEQVTVQSAELDLHELPRGIYLLTAYDDIGKVGYATITKN